MAETKEVTATLTVSFASGAQANNYGIVLEVDDRPKGLNKGKTSFKPGDTVYYLMYVPPGVTITYHAVTAGSKASAGGGVREVTDEDLSFTFSRDASLRYPCSPASFSHSWLGSPKNPDDGATGPVVLADDARSISVPEDILGILRCDYNAPYSAFKLSGVAAGVDSVLIGVKGEYEE